MLKDPVYLKTLDLIHTTGFTKLMTIIWSPVILLVSVCITYSHFKGKHRRKGWR